MARKVFFFSVSRSRQPQPAVHSTPPLHQMCPCDTCRMHRTEEPLGEDVACVAPKASSLCTFSLFNKTKMRTSCSCHDPKEAVVFFWLTFSKHKYDKKKIPTPNPFSCLQSDTKIFNGGQHAKVDAPCSFCCTFGMCHLI